jgi:hypothetical protein
MSEKKLVLVVVNFKNSNGINRVLLESVGECWRVLESVREC